MSPFFLQLDFSDEVKTAQTASKFARLLKAGDTVLFEGQIGAGKSAFCRAIIRSLCGHNTEVPSPTFTIVQTYEAHNFEVWHCDLYRLGDPDEVIELGIEAAFETAAVLVEWPDRLGDVRPNDALTISITTTGDTRHFAFCGSKEWAARIGTLND